MPTLNPVIENSKDHSCFIYRRDKKRKSGINNDHNGEEKCAEGKISGKGRQNQ
ncbi:hypothetical protein ABMA58_20655 [Oceanospirillum sp. HFRX-1_2]